MRKLIKNNKGFTLIELMMVIAVIGILAAVLVPKMGGIKDNAKLSGVDSNARQVEAHVHGLIERYRSNASSFDEALINVIGKSTESASNDVIVNPFDNTKRGANITGSASTAAVIIIPSDSDVKIPSNNESHKGIIFVKVNKASTESVIKNVEIAAFDNHGNKIFSKVIEP